MRFVVPIKLPSLPNMRLHWRALAKLKKEQRAATAAAMNGLELPPLPLVVTITRVGSRKLDSDNLAASAKYVRDQIADRVGEDDGSDMYTWNYAQERGKEYCVLVEIVTR